MLGNLKILSGTLSFYAKICLLVNKGIEYHENVKIIRSDFKGVSFGR